MYIKMLREPNVNFFFPLKAKKQEKQIGKKEKKN